MAYGGENHVSSLKKKILNRFNELNLVNWVFLWFILHFTFFWNKKNFGCRHYLVKLNFHKFLFKVWLILFCLEYNLFLLLSVYSFYGNSTFYNAQTPFNYKQSYLFTDEFDHFAWSLKGNWTQESQTKQSLSELDDQRSAGVLRECWWSLKYVSCSFSLLDKKKHEKIVPS